jgi:hypothetical protein
MRFLTLLLLGCSPMRPASSPTDDSPWWSTTSGGSAASTTEEGEDWDEDDDDEGEDLEDDVKLLWAELELVGDTPEEGLFGYYDAGPDGEHCDLDYVVEVVGPASGCEACVSAFTLRLTEVEIFADDGACEKAGVLGLEGTTYEVGHTADMEAMRNEEGTWTGGGYTELEPDFWLYEFEL